MLMPGSTCKICAVSLTVKNTSSIHILAKGPQSGTISKESIRFSVIKKSRYIHCSEFDSFLLYQIAINFLIISL